MVTNANKYEYILYIDEAGDDGLKAVMPIDENGGSEWLSIGAVLVRVDNEKKVVQWVRDIRKDINAIQGPDLHFRKLSPKKKLRTCKLMSDTPCVYFAVLSNKKNMRGYNNVRAENRGGKQWFYNFVVRLLIERVTSYCLRDSLKRYNESRYLKVVFSQRGGHSYGQTKAYWELLKAQASNGSTFLAKREVRHEVLRFDLVDYAPHTQIAGLQLADIIASAFYQAADTLGPRWNPEPAKLLKSRMAREGGVVADFGVVLQPTPPEKAKLERRQKEIFKFYGYSF